MYFEKEVAGGRHFMELEFKADGAVDIKRRGFITRARGRNPVQQQQATESPLIHDGSQTALSTAQDARNSTLTGTTQAGPSGSGQYLCVVLSSAANRTVSIASSTSGASYATAPFYGVLQNKPRPTDAADVGIFGISKVVAGSTTIVAGSLIMMSTAGGSSLNGTVNLWASGSGPRVGMSLESVTAVGQVITAMVFNTWST